MTRPKKPARPPAPVVFGQETKAAKPERGELFAWKLRLGGVTVHVAKLQFAPSWVAEVESEFIRETFVNDRPRFRDLERYLKRLKRSLAGVP